MYNAGIKAIDLRQKHVNHILAEIDRMTVKYRQILRTAKTPQTIRPVIKQALQEAEAYRIALWARQSKLTELMNEELANQAEFELFEMPNYV